MTQTIIIAGVTLSLAAARCAEESGCDVEEDLDDLRSNLLTEAALLDVCLDGADRDREQGWRDYVSALSAHLAAESPALAPIVVREFSTMPEIALEGWNPNALSGGDYSTDRARALYAALGVSESDEEYALARHSDGRWALFGLTVEGHRYAEESAAEEPAPAAARYTCHHHPLCLGIGPDCTPWTPTGDGEPDDDDCTDLGGGHLTY